MKIRFDPAKRGWTVEQRGLDFLDAIAVFEGRTPTLEDDGWGYGEPRVQTYEMLADRLVMLVWTRRGDARDVISMRHCHEREARKVVAISADPDDAPEWTLEMLARAELAERAVVLRPAAGTVSRPRGRPRVAHPKAQISVRLDRDVLDALRGSGRGWQARMNDALRKALGLA